MDLVRLLGCAIGIFSIILVLYFVLYYYPLPFYKENKTRRSYVGNDLRDSRKHAERYRPALRQGKVPVAERLHQAQKQRILGKEPSPDDPLYGKHERLRPDDGSAKERGQGDRLTEGQTVGDSPPKSEVEIPNAESLLNARRLESDSLHGAVRQEGSRRAWKQLQHPDQLYGEKRTNNDRLPETVRLRGDRTNEAQIQNEDPLRGESRYTNLLRAKLPDADTIRAAQQYLLEQASRERLHEFRQQKPDHGEPKEPMERRFMPPDSKDWAAMRENILMKAKKNGVNVEKEGLVNEVYDKDFFSDMRSPIPTRIVPEEPFHGSEHMLGR